MVAAGCTESHKGDLGWDVQGECKSNYFHIPGQLDTVDDLYLHTVWIQYISLFPWPITLKHPSDMLSPCPAPAVTLMSDIIPAHG